MVRTDAAGTSFWRRSHYLDRMTLRGLFAAYFQHHAIASYLVLIVASVALFIRHPAAPLPTIASIVLVAFAYPLFWYVLHRWVLHCHWMFKVRPLAGVWKRIHYDHHVDPNHLEVLFGALYTTLPTLLVVSALPGYLIGGAGGAAAGFATGLLCTCLYEFFHCIQHLAYKPRVKWLATMKVRHMEHHFHDEDGNYGITNFLWDRLFGTLYTRISRPRKSPTVFNLGYTEEVAARYPWVARRSGGVAAGHPRRRAGDTRRV
ncbi:sterol desaturase family protein [uncultured Sphingomonas sp.]|uniref:sterol desaturase family protein n=1 Tax=uncultured Sphingomonas sp. TaxID=158754 RepID=UPI0025E30155|nr:sterol desaturase family protein [uncultured Sphingomonas sp.]